VDLKDFVSSSLTQIIEGVGDAQKRAAASGAWISPVGKNIPHREGARKIETPNGVGYLEDVHFDVAITVSDQQQAGGGAGIQIFGAKLGADGNVKYQNEAVSRIQFTIPVVWPGDVRPELEEKLRREHEKENARARAANRGTY